MLARVKRSMEAIGQRTHVPVVTGVKMRLPWHVLSVCLPCVFVARDEIEKQRSRHIHPLAMMNASL